MIADRFSYFFTHLPEYALLAIVFLTMISLLVAAHELGHYLFARLFGMGVEEFAIGFGKKPLWTWMKRTYPVQEADGTEVSETTDFTVRPWPLGGFVRIKGMIPEDDGSEVRIPGGFYSKPPWQRLIVLFAGPAFSILFGILTLVPLYMTVGVEKLSNEPVITQMIKEGAAYTAGIRPGDRIVSVDGKPIDSFYSYIAYVRTRPGQKIAMAVDRKGQSKTFEVTPKLSEQDTLVYGPDMELTGEWKQQAIVGVLPPNTIMKRLSFGDAVASAANEPVRAVRGLMSLFERPKNFSNTVSGPVTIVNLTEAAIDSGFSKVISLAALLSISVGIFNLVPIGMLDGGQMLVAVMEMFRGGRRLSMRTQNALGGAGMLAILLLFISVMFVDVQRWIVPPDDSAPKTHIVDK